MKCEIGGVKMTDEMKDICALCEDESAEGTFWKFRAGDSSVYAFCNDCINKAWEEYESFMDFLLLKVEHRED